MSKIGTGFLNLTTIGARIVAIRATKLHIPMAVALFSNGKSDSELKLAR